MRHAGGGLCHDACKLVAKCHRLLNADRSETAMVIIMQIRPANAACLNPDTHLVWGQFRFVDLFNTQVFGCVDDDPSHSRISSRYLIVPPAHSTESMPPST